MNVPLTPSFLCECLCSIWGESTQRVVVPKSLCRQGDKNDFGTITRKSLRPSNRSSNEAPVGIEGYPDM